MDNRTYRNEIINIVKNVLRVRVPGLKQRLRIDAADEIARNIHARMYGANVDDVSSPLWRDSDDVPECDKTQPDKPAAELLVNASVQNGSIANLGGNPRRKS